MHSVSHGSKMAGVLLLVVGLLSCSANDAAVPEDPLARAALEDRAIGPILAELGKREESVGGPWERWFVSARLWVDSQQGPVLSESFSYRPRMFSDEVREVVNRYGYEFCAIDGEQVCADIWDRPATILAIGAATEPHSECPNAVWVGQMTVDKEAQERMPDYSSWYALACLAERDDGQLVVTDMTTYGIEG